MLVETKCSHPVQFIQGYLRYIQYSSDLDLSEHTVNAKRFDFWKSNLMQTDGTVQGRWGSFNTFKDHKLIRIAETVCKM
jgi:hypothetical protein